MEKKEYSKNERAERIVGKRLVGMVIDYPSELGYHCPVCKYEQEKDGYLDERLEWSEYKGFIYCRECNKDYPSCLCMPDIDKAIEIYLDCIEEGQKKDELVKAVFDDETVTVKPEYVKDYSYKLSSPYVCKKCGSKCLIPVIHPLVVICPKCGELKLEDVI